MLNFYNIYASKLKELNRKSWMYFNNQNFVIAEALTQQFYSILTNYNVFLNHDNEIQKLTNYQNVLNEMLKNPHNKINNKDYMINYNIDNDTQEVNSFVGYLKCENTINIHEIYNHIDLFLKKYMDTSEDFNITFSYNKKYKNNDYISFDINYDCEGLIHIKIDKNGFFKGDCMFLFDNNDSVIQFKNRINEIYKYFYKVIKKSSF